MTQETILLPLVVGIISSLFATAVFIIISEVFRTIVLPWASDKIYRGVRIDGEWKAIDIIEDDDNGDMQFSLKQWGDKISGNYFHLIKGKKESYKLTGSIKNMYFMATMEPTSNKKIDACALLMHVQEKQGNLILKGSLLYQATGGMVDAWNNILFQQDNF